MKHLQLIFTILLVSVYQPGCHQAAKADVSFGASASYYVPAVNGTKLAVDVYFPEGDKTRKLPALIELTRYWRSTEDPQTGASTPALRQRDSIFLTNDYILVKVDVRGTGASYGRRPGEYTPTEVQDAKYIVDWIVNQPWSDGSVGAYGTSYSGTTAELLCATGHEAVKAVIPGWSDFDIYESPGRPYGMLATSFIAEWSKVVHWLDNNATDVLQTSVRRVTATFPEEAIAEHQDNPDVLEAAKDAKYKDSKFGDFTHEECSPIHWQKEISESQVPMLVLASWMDAGTAEGALLRLQNFPNPQKVVLMPTAHGGGSHASPFIVSDKAIDPVPSVAEQLQLQLDFFDHYLKVKGEEVDDWPTVKYYNFGEEAFKTTDSWPPQGQSRVKYFLAKNGKLATSPSNEPKGIDEYRVDFSVSTGNNNRWSTQMGKPVLNLDNRNAVDSMMLTYTTDPFKKDLQITGTPAITLQLSSTHQEGAIFVYLEDIDPNGKSRYITEGGLLLEHRKISQNPMSDHVPYHSFYLLDAAPMPMNKVEEITFKLWPTSVLMKKGHSLRIAIAGSDKDTFDRAPKEGTPVYKVHRSKAYVSFIDLPVLKDF
ncbi:CocE/NonD family hydrolase [Lewinella cohaerens]|uniref:CocE/NonD family hydrolase n=1 Tax=Lewinella cohaerens TaxID=70995 RepID=UPI000364C638|nr:CocE/NonD family hydrolase [Lewinella cohaerens]